MSLGDNIKRYRELRNLTVQELADKMGIGKAGIYKWENGDTKPGIDSLTDLSKALDCTINDLTNENSTDLQKTGDNKQNRKTPRETFYLDLIENNVEYNLIPRAVLKDYKIVPDKIIDVIISSAENEKKALKEAMDMAKDSLIQKYELIIKGKENRIETLNKEKEDLRKENEDLRKQIPVKNK
jgi:transcriptional regulator with XRE-family HTH domain